MLGTRDQPKGFWPKPEELNFKRAISAGSQNWPKKIVSDERTSSGRKRAISVNFWAEMECCDPYFQPKLALSAEILSFGQLRFSAEMAETLSARIFGPNSGRNRNYAPFG